MSKAQWRIVWISGMGFFTDAYDLFIIGVVLKLLKAEWHIGSLETAIVGATALVSAAIGSAAFGRIADVFGRKYIYGFEVLVLGAGAIASAFHRISGGSSRSASSWAWASAATIP